MSAEKKRGLGRGLSALLDDSTQINQSVNHNSRSIAASPEVNDAGSINEILISEVEVNPYQPRTEFEAQALNELADSIKLQGLIQPITVRRLSAHKYQLISGERRLRASKIAGLTQVPAYIRTANDQQMLEMALIENIQRENLNAIETAISFQRMMEECNLKQEELGDRVSKSRSTVTNYLRLLKLPPAIQAAIRDGSISMGHARALISIESPSDQLYIHGLILKQHLSVRKVEEMVRNMQQQTGGRPLAQSKGKSDQALSYQAQKIQNDLASKFSTKVKLKVTSQGAGSIEIPFLSDDDLGRILELLDW